MMIEDTFIYSVIKKNPKIHVSMLLHAATEHYPNYSIQEVMMGLSRAVYNLMTEGLVMCNNEYYEIVSITHHWNLYKRQHAFQSIKEITESWQISPP